MIGRLLLLVFGAAMVFTAYMAYQELNCGQNCQQGSSFWSELFKTGFLLIGGAFTTIVGYYFGNAGAEEAQKQAELAQASAIEAKAQADKLAEQAKMIGEPLAPTTNEMAVGIQDAEIGEGTS